MTKFDKHWDTHCISSNCEEDEAKIHFEAGQQSKQAEIDMLKAKLDAIKSKLSDIYDASDEDETVAHLLDEIQEILK